MALIERASASFRLPTGTSVDVGLPPPGDVIGDQLRAGTYELPEAHRLVLSLLGPGRTLLDVGAHCGTLSVPAAAMGARVVAIEPNPDNVALLELGRELLEEAGEPADLTVLEAAAGASRGTEAFLPDGPWGRIVGAGTPGAIAVRTVTGHEALDLLGRSPDVVKLDVEGFELEALEGLAPLLAHRPPLVFECNAYALALRGRSASELLSAVDSLGYQVLRIDGGERLTPVVGVFQARSWMDCVGFVVRPVELASWFLMPPPTVDELAAEVAVQAQAPDLPSRLWLLDALADAPAEVLAHDAVVATLRALGHDDDRAVRRRARRLRAGAWWRARRRSGR